MRRTFATVAMITLLPPAVAIAAQPEPTKHKTKPAPAAAAPSEEAKKDWFEGAVGNILTGPGQLMRMTPENAPGYSPIK